MRALFIFGEVGMAGGFRVLHCVLLANQTLLAAETAQREVRRVRELSRPVRLRHYRVALPKTLRWG